MTDNRRERFIEFPRKKRVDRAEEAVPTAGCLEVAERIEILGREKLPELGYEPVRLLRSLVASLEPGNTARARSTSAGSPFLVRRTVQHESAHAGRPDQTTQIYEGTNQIQRMVIAKRLLG